MYPIEFKEQTIIIAEDQPEYINLPAHVNNNDECIVITTCWNLSFIERVKLLLTGNVWQQTMTFKSPLQPQKLSIEKPDLS